MHFLEFVFPLQLPFHKPGIKEGGRGWLFALIMKCRPLYYTVLSISAFHRKQMQPSLVCPVSKGALSSTINGQDCFYSVALIGLSDLVGSLRTKPENEWFTTSIYILACVTQLILIEVSYLLLLIFKVPLIGMRALVLDCSTLHVRRRLEC
jgi:hypothetical protein